MKPEKKERSKWWFYVTVACAAILFYVLITHITPIYKWIAGFIGNFTPIIIGCVLAYIMNPLSRFLQKTLFKKIKNQTLGRALSVILSLIVFLSIMGFLIFIVIPQLFTSVTNLAGNLDFYIGRVRAIADQWNIAKYIDFDRLNDLSEDILHQAMNYITDNIESIANTTVNVGRTLVNWVLGFIISIYLLMAKDRIKAGFKSFLQMGVPASKYPGVAAFLKKGDAILVRYIVYSLIDALIIGVVNAVFMMIMGMSYNGLVSMAVALTNLVPTFGPVVGALIGAVILVLVKPVHALIFLIFTLVLQTIDGYVLKPKLFGNSLGISSLLVLISIIIGGNMFGIIGILVAIPAAAILDLLYREYAKPWIEKKKDHLSHREKRNGEEKAAEEIPEGGE